jgi:hypothetical protein
MSTHLFFSFTLPDWPLPPAPAVSLLLFEPFEPLPPPLFFAPSLPPCGDVAVNRRPLRACCPWDLVDGIVRWCGCCCGCCSCCGCCGCSSLDERCGGCEEVGCGSNRRQPVLVWLMWRGCKTGGTYRSNFRRQLWTDSPAVKRGIYNTSELIDWVAGSILDVNTFF